MKKRFLCLMASGVMSIALLSGCSMFQKNGSGKTLTFWHNDIQNESVYLELAQKYMEANNVTIEVSAFNENEYLEKWIAASEAGTLPDIFTVLPGDDLTTFTESGNLAEINAKKDIPDGYDTRFLEFSTVGDKVWAVPVAGDVPVIAYNAAQFEEVAKSVPLNVADFTIFCQMLSQKGYEPFGFSYNEYGNVDVSGLVETVFSSVKFKTTEKFIENGYFVGGEDTEKSFYEVAGMLRLFQLSDYFDFTKVSKTKEELITRFTSGEVSMIQSTYGEVSALQKAYPDMGIGYFALGNENNIRSSSFSVKSMLGISDKSNEKKIAKDFISYLVSDEEQTFFANNAKAIPILNNIVYNESINKDAFNYVYEGGELSFSLLERLGEEPRKNFFAQTDSILKGDVYIDDASITLWMESLGN